MKTWWQRKTVGIEVVMMWVLGILVVSVFVLWATAGRAEYAVCLGSVFDELIWFGGFIIGMTVGLILGGMQ